MALYRIDDEGEGLVAFTKYSASEGLYESEVEDLLWENLDDLLRMPLFKVARQARLPHGGKPDILALDISGRPVVIEVKRDLDRSQLAQALEYAGWARSSNLQEISALYSSGPEQFWSDWLEFTGTDQPVSIVSAPRMVLAAASFHERTQSALDFLRENGLPLMVLTVGMYRDEEGKKFLDVDREDTSNPVQRSVVPTAVRGAVDAPSRRSFSVSVADLLSAGLLREGETLSWERPRTSKTHQVTVERDGRLRLPTGQIASSLSGAASACAGGGSFPGWECWRNETGRLLYDLRNELAQDAEEELFAAE